MKIRRPSSDSFSYETMTFEPEGSYSDDISIDEESSGALCDDISLLGEEEEESITDSSLGKKSNDRASRSKKYTIFVIYY